MSHDGLMMNATDAMMPPMMEGSDGMPDMNMDMNMDMGMNMDMDMNMGMNMGMMVRACMKT